ncbi:MAG: hypothetical protein K2X27_11050 [Candidatus Obscuribacterales bacterium]|nr:hypothetical protein [Candidatus Obscuribacterales bacterium]
MARSFSDASADSAVRCTNQFPYDLRLLTFAIATLLFGLIWVQPVWSQDSSPDNSSVAPPLAPAFTPVNSAAPSQPVSAELSELEFKLFAHDFPNESVEKRLDRLERLVYGAKLTAPVESRIQRLMRDVPSIQSVSSPAPDDQTESSAVPSFRASDQATSLSEQVGDMEAEVFGRTYPQDSLLNRVGRLERNVFPEQQEQTLTPLPSRIQHLMSALAPAIQTPEIQSSNSLLRSHSRSEYQLPYQANSEKQPNRVESNFSNASYDSNSSTVANNNDDKDKSKGHHPIIHTLGKILGGVGTIAGETLGSMAYGSALGYGA